MFDDESNLEVVLVGDLIFDNAFDSEDGHLDEGYQRFSLIKVSVGK